MTGKELGHIETTEQRGNRGKNVVKFFVGFILFLGMIFLLFQARSMIFIAWNTGQMPPLPSSDEPLIQIFFLLVFLFIDWGCIVLIIFITLVFLFVARFTMAGLGFIAGAITSFFCWFTYGIFYMMGFF